MIDIYLIPVKKQKHGFCVKHTAASVIDQAKSDALSKASKLSTQYESKSKPPLLRMLSDSDMEISLSTETNNYDFHLGDASALTPG